MPGARIIGLQLNQKKCLPFSDARVRRAMAYAYDNEKAVKCIMKGFATAAEQNSPEGYIGHIKRLKPRFDLEKARQLLKDAGYESGFECTMIAPNNRYINDEKLARAFVTMMTNLHIKVHLETFPKSQYWKLFHQEYADIQMLGWHSDTEDSANFFEILYMCPDKESGIGRYNTGHYCNPEVGRLTRLSNRETNIEKRAAMLKTIEKILYDDAAFIPLHWQNQSWASKANIAIEEIVNTSNLLCFSKLRVEP